MLPFPLQLRPPKLQLTLNPSKPTFNLIRCSIPNPNPKPRDIVLDFGKHRGKMLGSLPSPYLQWISKTLRTGDTEHWARLADQVLEDPVYKDRVEWEYAEKVLNGDVLMTMDVNSGSSVEALVEVSERFGWDNEDKIGWSKVKFELLGTSKGGRIPRVNDKAKKEEVKIQRRKSVVVEDAERVKRREERRVRRVKGSLGNVDVCDGESSGDSVGRVHNPFPGRESLLRKAAMGRGRGL